MSPRPPAPGEEVLTRDGELWWRQCPDDDDCWDPDLEQPSGLMFRWSEGGELSGAREDKSTAKQAYDHHVDVEKKASKGTWAVPVKAVKRIDMQLIDDSANLPDPPESPPGHTYFDARDVSTASSKTGKAEREKVRSALLRAAVRLGRQYPAADASGDAISQTDGGPGGRTPGDDSSPPGPDTRPEP